MISPDEQLKRLDKFVTTLQRAKYHGEIVLKFYEGHVVHMTQSPQSYKLEAPTPIVVAKFDIQTEILTGT